LAGGQFGWNCRKLSLNPVKPRISYTIRNRRLGDYPDLAVEFNLLLVLSTNFWKAAWRSIISGRIRKSSESEFKQEVQDAED